MSNPETLSERDKAAAELVQRLVTRGHRVLVLCYACDTDPYIPAPHPCEEKRGGGGVWALRPANASSSAIKNTVKDKNIDRIVLDLNRDLIVLQDSSFYDLPNVDLVLQAGLFYDRPMELLRQEAMESGEPIVTAEQQREVIDDRQAKKTERCKALYNASGSSVRTAIEEGELMIVGGKRGIGAIGTETGRLTSEKSNMCSSRMCDACGRVCTSVPVSLVHFNCEPCRLAERELTMRVLSQVKEAGKTGLALHDIQKAVAEVVKHPHTLTPNGSVILCDPPFKYKDRAQHQPVGGQGYVYVDSEKYEAGIAACFNKALAPGMDRCKIGDAVRLRNGKCVGRIKEIRYTTAPLQAVVELISGEPETYQLHNLELVNACVEVSEEPKPAGEEGETKPQECMLGTVEQLEPPSEENVEIFDRFAFPLIRAVFPNLKEAIKEPMADEEMTARDAEEANRHVLFPKEMKKLYEHGKGIEFPADTQLTKIVVRFNLPQEPPCTCENVNLPHTPNCPWKKWKNKQK